MDARALRKGSLDSVQEAPWSGQDTMRIFGCGRQVGSQERQVSELQSWGWTPWGPGCREFGPIRIEGTMQAPKQAVRHGGEA